MRDRHPSVYQPVLNSANRHERRIAKLLSNRLEQYRQTVFISDVATALSSRNVRRAMRAMNLTALDDALKPVHLEMQKIVAQGKKIGARKRK